MIKKIALNVFYNLGIILSLFGVFWSVENDIYAFIPLFVITAAFFIYVKIQFAKSIRNSLRK